MLLFFNYLIVSLIELDIFSFFLDKKETKNQVQKL